LSEDAAMAGVTATVRKIAPIKIQRAADLRVGRAALGLWDKT